MKRDILKTCVKWQAIFDVNSFSLRFFRLVKNYSLIINNKRYLIQIRGKKQHVILTRKGKNNTSMRRHLWCQHFHLWCGTVFYLTLCILADALVKVHSHSFFFRTLKDSTQCFIVLVSCNGT